MAHPIKVSRIQHHLPSCAIHRILKVSVHCCNDLLRARPFVDANGRLWTPVTINGMAAYLCLVGRDESPCLIGDMQPGI